MNCLWPASTDVGELSENEVHVWCANLEPASEQLAALEETLLTEESERADGFRFWRHRRRYVAARGILRLLLGAYLNQPASDIVISYSEYGKPYLRERALQFNVSHSKEIALFSFCLAASIGIDVEKIRPISDVEGIAARFFSSGEYARLQALPVQDRDDAFFACWTRKEAFIKADGEGLSYPLSNFDVAFLPDENVRVIAVHGSPDEASRWSLFSLNVADGYAAALAVLGHEWQLLQRHYRVDI